MKHLSRDRLQATWCGRITPDEDAVDPHDADCAACLREAATYGAKAAMRCAAVEAGASSDPEIAAERDAAIAELDKLRGIIGQHGLFACAGCSRLFSTDLVGFHVGLTAWCGDCSTMRGRIL